MLMIEYAVFDVQRPSLGRAMTILSTLMCAVPAIVCVCMRSVKALNFNLLNLKFPFSEDVSFQRLAYMQYGECVLREIFYVCD